jgi:hypothetical protein
MGHSSFAGVDTGGSSAIVDVASREPATRRCLLASAAFARCTGTQLPSYRLLFASWPGTPARDAGGVAAKPGRTVVAVAPLHTREQHSGGWKRLAAKSELRLHRPLSQRRNGAALKAARELRRHAEPGKAVCCGSVAPFDGSHSSSPIPVANARPTHQVRTHTLTQCVNKWPTRWPSPPRPATCPVPAHPFFERRSTCHWPPPMSRLCGRHDGLWARPRPFPFDRCRVPSAHCEGPSWPLTFTDTLANLTLVIVAGVSGPFHPRSCISLKLPVPPKPQTHLHCSPPAICFPFPSSPFPPPLQPSTLTAGRISLHAFAVAVLINTAWSLSRKVPQTNCEEHGIALHWFELPSTRHSVSAVCTVAIWLGPSSSLVALGETTSSTNKRLRPLPLERLASSPSSNPLELPVPHQPRVHSASPACRLVVPPALLDQ